MSELGLSREQRDIARRWCILNCWGWPSDLPMPLEGEARDTEARRLMAKCVREIGIERCLAYWNGQFRDAQVKVEGKWGSRAGEEEPS